jgi:radical SAM protein with 4Fe4S-binding SPASM domain
MGVFHIAFGGGEVFLRSDAIELAKYARSRGIIPNATTNGYAITPALAAQCTVFGQVNISLDALGIHAGIVRGNAEFNRIDKAIKELVKSGVSTGINCVVTRVNFDQMGQVARYAQDTGLKEVLFLRLKPSGRARDIYHQYALTPAQARALYPQIAEISQASKLVIQTDCSFIPHICAHSPSIEAMKVLGVEGCGAGDMLLGVDAEGAINGCSHHGETLADVLRTREHWNEHAHFSRFRNRRAKDPRCIACSYAQLCKGGCPLFSEFLLGDFEAADPECPILSAKQ